MTNWKNRIVGHGSKPASQFQAHPNNWRKHPQNQRRAVKGSLDSLGWIDTVIENVTTGRLIDGHERVWDALQNGDAEVPFIQVELTEAEEAQALLSLDAIAALAETDREQVNALLEQVETDNADVMQFLADFAKESGLEWGQPEQGDAEPDESEEGKGAALEKWNVKYNDLFIVGNHKLLCGDSTSRDDIQRLLSGNKYCVLTDPPYNIGFEYNGMDDKMTSQGYSDFCKAWFEVVNDAECLIFSPGPKNIRLYPTPRDTGYWQKRYASAGASAFNLRTIEPLLIYGKIGKKRNFDLFDYSSGFPEELRAAQRAALVEDVHPPAKPIGLWNDLLGMLPDGIPVLDCFSGNGTTFMACQNNGRVCYGNERDPSYCALILERMSTAFPGIEIRRL